LFYNVNGFLKLALNFYKTKITIVLFEEILKNSKKIFVKEVVFFGGILL